MSLSRLLRVGVVVGVLVAGLLTASPAHGVVSYSEIRAFHSDSCVDVSGASQATGAPVQQWRCLGAGQGNQHWALIQVGTTGFYELQARHSGKCLNQAGFSNANGAPVDQWDCLGSGQFNQQVSLRPVGGAGSGYFQLIFRHSGKCLDVPGVSTSNGVRLHQWDCLPGAPNQRFRFDPIT